MSQSAAERTTKTPSLDAQAAEEIIVAAPWVDELEDLSSDALEETGGGTLVMVSAYKSGEHEAKRPSHTPNVTLQERVHDDSPEAVDARSEQENDRTMRLSREDFIAAQQAKNGQNIPPPPDTAPVLARTQPQVSRTQAPRTRSVAPVALDVTVAIPRTPGPPSVMGADSIYEMPPPRSPSPMLGFTIGAVGVAVVLAVVGVIAAVAVTGGSSAQTEPKDDAPKAAATQLAAPSPPKEPELASTVVVAPPAPGTATTTTNTTATAGTIAAPTPAPGQPAEMDVSSLPSAAPKTAVVAAPPVERDKTESAPAPRAHAAAPEPKSAPAPEPPPPPKTAAAAPAPAPTPTPSPAAAANGATTGVIRVPVSDSILTITVDGTYRKVHSGSVVVSCGQHRVRVGTGMQQEINVPCGGAVSVQ